MAGAGGEDAARAHADSAKICSWRATAPTAPTDIGETLIVIGLNLSLHWWPNSLKLEMLHLAGNEDRPSSHFQHQMLEIPGFWRCIGNPHRPLKQLTNTNPLERISDRLQNRRPAIVPEATEVERMATCAHRRRLHLAAVQAVQRLSGQATGKRWCSGLHASTARAATHRTHHAARLGQASSGGKSKYCLRCQCPA